MPIDADAVWPLLVRLHRDGRRRIDWRRDLDTWGVRERWGLPLAISDVLSVDDCDGFTFWWIDRLEASGVPARDVAPYFCRTPSGAGHLVCAVATTRGVYVLDNTRPPGDVRAIDALPYTDWRRPAPGAPLDADWQTLAV